MSKLRWNPYVLRQNEDFLRFWTEHLHAHTRRVAIIAGLGFDARACLAAERILEAAGDGPRDLWLICYENGQSDAPSIMPLVNANDQRFQKAFADRGVIHRLPLSMRGEHGRIASATPTTKLLRDHQALYQADDIVIDISAMPRMIAMTLISYIVAKCDDLKKAGANAPNVHIAVAENVALDVEVTEGTFEEEVVHVPGLTGRIGAESINNPIVWLPILGEGQSVRLQRIFDKLQPNEICPIIPFPSRNPRRGDALIEEYRQLLFDEYRVDPRNIVYASEFNPFEAYRQIFRTVERYKNALAELGSCRAIITPLSSKLLSVGAVLAALDHRAHRKGQFHIGMHYVEAGSYRPPPSDITTESDLSGLWVQGEWEE